MVTTLAPGIVSLDEVSFLSTAALDALQPGSSSLVTLSFSGLAIGSSPVSFGSVDLSDAEFPASTLTATLEVGVVTVIPEPTSAALLFIGLAGLTRCGFRSARTIHRGGFRR